MIGNRSKPRLDEIEAINKTLNPGSVKCSYYLTPEPGQNDKVMEEMGKGSLIINATGLGKDRPGSPLTDAAQFPQDGLVWEINYRGDLLFMHQAEAQEKEKNLHVEDGLSLIHIYYKGSYGKVSDSAVGCMFHWNRQPVCRNYGCEC